MANQYREQYGEQYKKAYREETAQIHAPADLIEKTKAAMRAEEERILRERTAQPGMAEPRVTYADYAKYGKTSSLRKWTYPLTAVAALLILVSVSLTMRGLKSESPAMDGASGAAYEESAMLTNMAAEVSEGVAESAEEAMAAESADAGASEAILESAADVTESERADTGGALYAPAADMVESAGTSAENDAEAKKSMAQESMEKAESADDSEIEDAIANLDASRESKESEESLADNVTVEKVQRKPAFCGRPGTKTYIHEGTVFQVAKDGDAWVAYVEIKSGEGYVLHGEMEDVEEFLEKGYEKLSEVK